VCIGGASFLVLCRTDHARSFESAPGIQLPRARDPLAIDTTRVTLVVDRDGHAVDGPKLQGGGARPVNVEADARTPFSRVAAAVNAAREQITQVSFVVQGLDGRIGTLAAQPLATPQASCILGLAPHGDAVVKRPWYDTPALIKPYREADEADEALRASGQSDAGGHALQDLLDAAGGSPCAQVCRDGCAPVLSPDPEVPFQDVVRALESAGANVCLAWQPPK
jgi:hypothetical protein